MEKKELRAKIIALKKSSGKGAVSKERKKEIQAEILELEESLKQLEIVKDEPVGQNDETVNSLATSSQNQEPSPTKKKKKERKNKLVEQFELKQKEALLEQENEPNLRELEHEAIAKILSPLNLQVHEIRPDGHCLYSSISHQLLADSEKKSYQELRAICASEMRRNESEFMPFMVDEDGKSMDHEQYLDYCDKIENTAVWGGQYELLALSNALEREIKIYQADMPVSVMGEQFKEKKPLLIS